MTKKLLQTCLTIARHYLPNHPRKDGYKHFSFIVQHNQLVEWGTNRSAPPLFYYGYEEHQMLHSENVAYKKARGLLNSGEPFEVVNIRMNIDGSIKISKPCPCCIAFLKNLGCKRIWYTDESGCFRKMLWK